MYATDCYIIENVQYLQCTVLTKKCTDNVWYIIYGKYILQIYVGIKITKKSRLFNKVIYIYILSNGI